MEFKLYSKATHALRYWLLRRLPTCRSMASVMSASLERRLTLRERLLLRLHLWVCIWCVWYLEQLRFMREALRARASQISDDESSLPGSLSPAARRRLKRKLSSEAE